MADSLAAHEEGFWRSCAKPSPTPSPPRQLFAYALVSVRGAAASGTGLDRLFALAEQMQDRDPQSRGYGNFWWAMRDKKVMDYNAVDFSMRGGALPLAEASRFHSRAGAAASGEIAGSLPLRAACATRFNQAYSNIAIMNAGNLICPVKRWAGRKLPPKVTRGSDQVFRYTQAAGIHEFDNPTYTGVDLDGLGMIEAFCRRDAGRPETERGKSRRI